jgi:hypothetical protein
MNIVFTLLYAVFYNYYLRLGFQKASVAALIVLGRTVLCGVCLLVMLCF